MKHGPLPDEPISVTVAHTLHWDIETRSFADLDHVGTARYAADPSTEVQCIAFLVDDGPIQHCIPDRDPIPQAFLTAAVDPSWRIASHNDGFETPISVHVLGPRFGWPLIPIERHICTMAMARYHGLPGALEKVAEYLGLPVQKDAAGKRLMLKLSRPDKNGNFIEPTADELKQLIAYCRLDVEVERAIFHALAALPATEQALWQLDRRINDRGFAIDITLATRARQLAAVEKRNINARLRDITGGTVEGFTKIEAIREFVNARGLAMTELDKPAVVAALKRDIDSTSREVLELRQAAASNIEAKFDAVLATTSPDHRSYGLLHFYGTHTGRWTSSGFNAHNLPREAGEHISEAIAAIQAGELERLREFGSPLKLIASTVRGLVIAPDGKLLLIGDFSTIEPRIAAWLADETWKIENFYAFDRTGDPMLDTYRVLGAKMRGVPVDPNDKATRQHGKTVTMAFTFGAGVRVWRQHLPDDPRSDDEIKAQEVMQFRRLHPKQTQFMYQLEAQALRCVASGKPIVDKRHSFEMMGDTLIMRCRAGARCSIRAFASSRASSTRVSSLTTRPRGTAKPKCGTAAGLRIWCRPPRAISWSTPCSSSMPPASRSCFTSMTRRSRRSTPARSTRRRSSVACSTRRHGLKACHWRPRCAPARATSRPRPNGARSSLLVSSRTPRPSRQQSRRSSRRPNRRPWPRPRQPSSRPRDSLPRCLSRSPLPNQPRLHRHHHPRQGRHRDG